ncbi:MAG: amidase [Desulfobacterales bacterium]|nr:amidase [Desulfobacterales bacterium]
MPTTAGATALRDSYVRRDSEVARKLRQAGAVILAKANLSEWANFRASYSSSGWSGVGGQTRNPYVLDRNPCGSSSGSGVAVAASLCALAIGTETNGSIVCPANNNGIVGIKPTVGLISRSGIIPISSSQDTAGPMARTVEDAVACLGALTGVDEADSKTAASRGNCFADYTPFLKKDGLRGKRIGLLKNLTGYHYRVDALLEGAAAFLKSQGAEVVEVQGPKEGPIEGDSFQVMLYEFKDGLNKYFAGLAPAGPVRDVAQLIEFNKKDAVELRWFDQKLLEQAQEKGGLEAAEYKKALASMLKAAREDGIDKLLAEHKLDALMAPTGAPAWKTDLVVGDHFMGSSSSLAAIAGYPSITVPMGFVGELPVGVSFFASAWSEPVLIEIAYAYEQGTKHRRAPKYLTSIREPEREFGRVIARRHVAERVAGVVDAGDDAIGRPGADLGLRVVRISRVAEADLLVLGPAGAGSQRRDRVCAAGACARQWAGGSVHFVFNPDIADGSRQIVAHMERKFHFEWQVAVNV